MKPEAQPRHRQDSQQHKDALGRTAPQGDGAGSASPREGCAGSSAHAGQVIPPRRQARTPPPHLAAPVLRRGVETPWRCRAGMTWTGVTRPSRRDGQEPPALRTARICTTCRSKRQRVRLRLVHRSGAQARPIRRMPVRRYRGAPSHARRGESAGLPPGGKRSAQHRRREGVRDGSRMAVTAKSARGAAREPDGALRRHAHGR
jgi:hypothetical protein